LQKQTQFGRPKQFLKPDSNANKKKLYFKHFLGYSTWIFVIAVTACWVAWLVEDGEDFFVGTLNGRIPLLDWFN
jgi:hypothetical protein